jgi:NADH-quinone oxidoreductase subunit G
VLASIAALAREIGAVTDTWNGFNVLHSAASRVGGLDIGFVPGEGGKTVAQMAAGGVDVLFNLGADEVEIGAGPFVVYVGTHGDRGAHRADVVLPAAAYTEKSGTWVNTEGRVQTGSRAAFPPGDAREDWAIFRALSATLGEALPFDNLAALRRDLVAAIPVLASRGLTPADSAAITHLADRAGTLSGEGFRSRLGDFYLTNPIARASKVMAECSKLARPEHLEAAE